MPTGGTARFSSPVNVDDFLKIISVFGLGPRICDRQARRLSSWARAESLEAHGPSDRVPVEQLSPQVDNQVRETVKLEPSG